MKRALIIIAINLLFLAGCAGTTDKVKKPCIKENMKNLILRWGGHNYKSNILSGYQLDANANLYEFIKAGKNSDYISKKIAEIDNDKLCNVIRDVQSLFVKIQALNAPGDSSNFVEYINPGTNTKARAVWNVEFETYGSREFRELFDSLDAFVPSKGQKVIIDDIK